MPLSAAARMARTRARRAAGKRSYRHDLTESLIEDALVVCGYLSAAEAEDRRKVDAALPIAIEAWAEAQLTPPAAPDDGMLRATSPPFDFCHGGDEKDDRP